MSENTKAMTPQLEQIKSFCEQKGVRHYAKCVRLLKIVSPELYRYVTDDPDGAKKAAVETITAELRARQDAGGTAHEPVARMTLLDRIEAYCLDNRLFTYQDFIMSARLNAKHLAEYADARGIGPGRRAQIQERIDAAKAAFQESRAKKGA